MIELRVRVYINRPDYKGKKISITKAGSVISGYHKIGRNKNRLKKNYYRLDLIKKKREFYRLIKQIACVEWER